MLSFIMSLLIVCFFLVMVDFFGYLINQKLFKKDFLINIPVGTISFFGIFQIIALIPMVLHLNFYIFRNIVVILFLLISVFLIKKYFKEYISFYQNIKKSYLITYLILSIVLAIMLFLLAVGFGDTWLYSSMALSSIDTNIIFNSNGFELGGLIQSWHYTDSYYLFQAILASFYEGDKFVYLITFIKIIEAFIILSGFALIIEFYLQKNRKLTLIIVSLALILGINFFTPYNLVNEVYGHVYRSMALGINVINCMLVITSFTYLHIYLESENNISELKEKIMFVILANSFFSFSSSSLFIYSCFIAIFILLAIFVYNDKDKVKPLVFSLLVVYVYAVIYLFNISLISILLLIIGYVLYRICLFIYNKLKLETIKKIVNWLLIIYVILNIIGIIYLGNTTEIIKNLFSLQQTQVYSIAFPYYSWPLTNLIYFILFVFGLRNIYLNYKFIYKYILIVLILFANLIVYRTVGTIIDQVVYHRVFVLYLPGIIALFGLNYLLNYFDYKYCFNQKKYLYAILVIFCLFFPKYDNKFLGFDNFDAYKYQSNDLKQLVDYDYPLTNNISLATAPTGSPDGLVQLDNLIRAKGNVNWVECSKDGYYLISPKENNTKGEIVLQTENYNVYYKDGSSCLIEEQDEE